MAALKTGSPVSGDINKNRIGQFALPKLVLDDLVFQCVLYFDGALQARVSRPRRVPASCFNNKKSKNTSG